MPEKKSLDKKQTKPATASTSSSIKDEKDDDCQQKLVQYEAQLVEYLAGWRRAQADYQNLKKQTAQEKVQLSGFVKAQVLTEFFPAIDNLYTASRHIPPEAKALAWVQGFLHLEQQFTQTLENMGVTKIITVGQQFDVTCMEAVEQQESEQYQSGTVIREIRSGYKINEMVVAVAKVVVAR